MRYFFLGLILGVTSCQSQTIESNIVLVNVETLDRKGIADEINIINSLNPKVLAIDLQFSQDTETEKDYLLLLALEKVKNLVMVSVIDNYNWNNTNHIRFTRGSLPEYLIGAKTGFGNTILEDDRNLTLKRFSTHEEVNVDIEYHFAVRTAMAFDSLKALNFVENNPKILDVDYLKGKRKFKKLSATEVLQKKLGSEEISGKIVMMGFLGPGDEDKFYTPLNTNPNKPDMYGLEYLANIVAQVLESK